MPRIPGLESIRPSISKRECNVAFEEAEIILAEMQREFDIQKQNIAHLTHLEEIHYRVSKEGVTESIKEQYRASFEALEIDTAIGQEGLLDVISDIMTAIRRGLDRISMWFEDKWNDLVDAHYEGLKHLTAWRKASGTILAKVTDEQLEQKKARSWDRKTLLEVNAAVGNFSKGIKAVVNNIKATNGSELEALVIPLGGHVEVAKSRVFNIEWPVVGPGKGLPDTSKATLKELGFSKSEIVADVDTVLKVFENYVTMKQVWTTANARLAAEVDRIENAMAKKEDKKQLLEDREQLNRYIWMGDAIITSAMIQYRAVRQVSFCMQRVCNAFGKA